MKIWMERYEEASSNQYSEDVQVLLRVKEQGDGKSLAYNTHPASFKPPVEVQTIAQCNKNNKKYHTALVFTGFVILSVPALVFSLCHVDFLLLLFF